MQFSHKSTALCDREQAKTGLHHVMRRNLQHSTLPQSPLKKKPLTGSDATRYTTRTQGAKSSMLSQVQAVVRAVVLYSRRYMYMYAHVFQPDVQGRSSFNALFYLTVEYVFWRFFLIFHVPYECNAIWLMRGIFIVVIWSHQQFWVLEYNTRQKTECQCIHHLGLLHWIFDPPPRHPPPTSFLSQMKMEAARVEHLSQELSTVRAQVNK